MGAAPNNAAGGDWAYEVAKDIREKWMQTAFMKGGDFALPAGHLSDMAEALRHAHATGYTIGHEAGDKYRSGKLVASTGSGEETKGATPLGSGSHPSDRTPSGSAGYAVSILRAALVQAAEEQVRYWRERQSHETCPEERMDDDGHYTPMGDDAAIRFGYCNGRLSEADWWLKTLQSTPLPTPPSVRDRSSEAAETLGSAEGKSPAPQGATP